MTTKTFKMKELVEKTGLPVRRLTQWISHQIIFPHTPSRRAGCAAYFSEENVKQCILIEKMANAGIVARAASKIALRVTESNPYVYCSINMENLDDFFFHNNRDIIVPYPLTLTLRII